MPETKEVRIKLRDFDPCTEMMILYDIRGLLTPLVISLSTFNKWRIDKHKYSGSRTQMYMSFIKRQGGKNTILTQVEKTRDTTHYKDFIND